jgi:hypothetical protein
LTIQQQFDDIDDKEITKRYKRHEIQHLSKRYRERETGVGRPFKLNINDIFLMLLMYYHLYITCTLAYFLFNIYQSSICRDIEKMES